MIGILLFLTASFCFLNGHYGQNKEAVASFDLNKKITEEDNVSRIDYVDSQGRLRTASDLGYATIIKTKAGMEVLEQYFDAKGDPAAAAGGYYSVIRVYDDNGNNTLVKYRGLDEELTIISTGCAIEEKAFSFTSPSFKTTIAASKSLNKS